MEQAGAVNLMVLAVAMALAAAIPTLAPRLPLPRPVIEIVLGAIVGPHILDLVHPDLIWDFLADFGLGMLFLMAGFEMDPASLRGDPIRNAAAGWAISLILALVVSMILLVGGVAEAPFLTALALCTTSIGLLLPVLRDGGLLAPPYGPAMLAAGALGEAAPLFLLPLALAHQGGAGAQALIMIGFGVAAAAAIVFASHASRGAFAAVIERTMRTSGQLPMRLAICLLILLVVLSQRFEIDFVLGAFVAGAVVRAALPRDLHEAMAARLDGIGSAFLVPVFFLSSGMRLDLAALMNDHIAAGMIAIPAALRPRITPQADRRPGAAFGHAALPRRRYRRDRRAARPDADRPGRRAGWRRRRDRSVIPRARRAGAEEAGGGGLKPIHRRHRGTAPGPGAMRRGDKHCRGDGGRRRPPPSILGARPLKQSPIRLVWPDRRIYVPAFDSGAISDRLRSIRSESAPAPRFCASEPCRRLRLHSPARLGSA
ncbi:cation:proton antiporter [Methylocapsa palsarum]|uniref:Kef-type K+ transport system, membrane component KefB n=1 Tax=Methylocapsa palsarum TaxID=1612308 RepID=A0A1I4BPP8_9HYPH|nr:cation:proton antiporter [Methylocapsa palsarum]SFK70808.1 Kef-type K+ transport system, membrane component KefB [Methylocapsa palsarum]